VSGRRVVEREVGSLGPGRHVVDLAAGHTLAPGLYLVRLVQGLHVRVARVVVANDVGSAINPLGLKGQIDGGLIMGIGHALSENFILEEGRVITDRLSSYRTPSITFTPEIHAFVVEHPTNEGPFGAKGVGEIVLIPTIPAITNAVYNAVGVRVDRIPVDQELILKELAARGEAADA
jgi:xanthine dehydrogenase molybdenum-binding subunit